MARPLGKGAVLTLVVEQWLTVGPACCNDFPNKNCVCADIDLLDHHAFHMGVRAFDQRAASCAGTMGNVVERIRQFCGELCRQMSLIIRQDIHRKFSGAGDSRVRPIRSFTIISALGGSAVTLHTAVAVIPLFCPPSAVETTFTLAAKRRMTSVNCSFDT